MDRHVLLVAEVDSTLIMSAAVHLAIFGMEQAVINQIAINAQVSITQLGMELIVFVSLDSVLLGISVCVTV